jgi:hypothetical protein
MEDVTKDKRWEIMVFFVIIVLVVGLAIVGPQKIGLGKSAAESDFGYYDDGKGLVLIDAAYEKQTFAALQNWRNAHPDRFTRLMHITRISDASDIIIAYYPIADDSLTTAKKEE